MSKYSKTLSDGKRTRELKRGHARDGVLAGHTALVTGASGGLAARWPGVWRLPEFRSV